MNKIINKDCLEALKEIPNESVDMVCFSPPYDAVRDYKDDWKLDLKTLGKELFRVTKDGGVCVVVIGDGTKDFAKSLTTARMTVDWVDGAGWKLFETCIYQRDGKPGAWWSKRFRVDHEYILIFFKGERPKSFDKSSLMVPAKHAGKKWSGTQRLTDGSLIKIDEKVQNPFKCRGTIWKYATSNSEGNKLKLKHPGTFPDKMAEDFILCFSKEGDTILDPTCGSGTTCVMAAKNKRQYIGIDVSKDYCKIAEERLKKEINK
jgi:site-specific DNA-methyltransferase (adenine-specific)